MEQVIETIMPAVLQLAGTVLMVLAGIIGYQVKKLYKKYVDTEEKASVIASTVQYVEQVYQDLHGAEKLEKAMQRASELLAEKGITITNEELETLIESAVNGFNNGYRFEKSGVNTSSNGE